jgi:hypothetical protein
MFTKTPTDDSALDQAIAKVYAEMSTTTSDTDEYYRMTQQLTALYALKATPSPRLSPDTVAVVAGNLLGIFVMVGHERAHVITSKALNFIMKAT